jgi:hypothetical protein
MNIDKLVRMYGMYDKIDINYEIQRARKDSLRAGLDIGLSLGVLLTISAIVIIWLVAH